MKSWILHGLRGGILTTKYPKRPDEMPTAYRGAVVALDASAEDQRVGAAVCPTGAIAVGADRARVDRLRCIQCGLCVASAPRAFDFSNVFELATVADDVDGARERIRLAARAFGRSVNVRHIDTGSDGSEEQELAAAFNPFYDLNRLGIFLTASPRHADILVVTGPVTGSMVEPLRRAYQAMPDPKVIVALGTSACSGGIFDPANFVGPVDRIIPVDVYVPGSPPSPLTILHGLLTALGHRTAGEGAA